MPCSSAVPQASSLLLSGAETVEDQGTMSAGCTVVGGASTGTLLRAFPTKNPAHQLSRLQCSIRVLVGLKL